MKNKVLFAVNLLLGLMMINSGLNKFFHYQALPEMSESVGKLMGAFAEAGWLFPLIAIAEIVGGALIIPQKTRALGTIILLPVIVGIFLTHAVLDPGTVAMSLALLAIAVWTIIENKNKYMNLIQG